MKQEPVTYVKCIKSQWVTKMSFRTEFGFISYSLKLLLLLLLLLSNGTLKKCYFSLPEAEINLESKLVPRVEPNMMEMQPANLFSNSEQPTDFQSPNVEIPLICRYRLIFSVQNQEALAFNMQSRLICKPVMSINKQRFLLVIHFIYWLLINVSVVGRHLNIIHYSQEVPWQVSTKMVQE